MWAHGARIETSPGLDPRANTRRLGRGATAVAATALWVFSFLTGLGSWLCHSPPPAW
jgi:hypothetical protein